MSDPGREKFLEELLTFAREERTDLAIRLVELNALRAEGEITDEDYIIRRIDLYA